MNGSSGSTAKDSGSFSMKEEARLLFRIAIPAVAVQFSVLFIFPQTASTVGRQLGTEDLAGFSLASLAGNLTILSVMVGALTAADTLMPRAYGMERYAEVGKLAVRALFTCTLLLIPPIVPLCTLMDWVFDKLGQDPAASELASQWIRAYLLCTPALLFFRVAQSFLNSQQIVMPLVVASVVSSFVVHPFVLKLMVPLLGFLGSGLAVSITNTVMAILVVAYLWIRPEHNPETWPGLSKEFILDSIQPKPVLKFIRLSMGGVLAFSEWWFWEFTCFTVGSFGIVPLCVHTIAYNLVPLLFMIPLGVSIGLTVRMGTVISSDVERAKKLAIYCMVFTVVLGLAVSLGLYSLRVPIVLLFTNDPEVLEGCVAIWPRLCVFIFVLNIFAINSGIMRALGMQWPMAIIILVCLWVFAVPTILYLAVYQGGGLDVVWYVLPSFYGMMQVMLMISYITQDWEAIGKSIQESARKSMSGEELLRQIRDAKSESTEDTYLLA